MSGRPSDHSTVRNEQVSTTDQQIRWIASGVLPFPDGLSSAESRQLARAVQRIRRERLIRLIARAIARDLHRSHQRKEDDNAPAEN